MKLAIAAAAVIGGKHETDEQVVRAFCPGAQEFVTAAYPVRILVDGEDIEGGYFNTWSDAKKFTEDWQEKIRLAEEEIQLVQCMIILLKAEKDDTTHITWKRILAREQAHLDSLKVGTVLEEKHDR